MLTPEKLDPHRVRLFPGYDIRSEREAELRAASTLLGVARAVSEFGRRIVAMAGGPAGRLECYTEVPFDIELDGVRKTVRPDGLLWVRRGAREWRALVEVKVGSQPLGQVQIDNYHTIASDEGIDALITISNEAALSNGLPPNITIDGRRARKVPVVHLSWDRLLSEAQMLSGQEEVADEDQHWMLDEWILYVNDGRARVIDPPQLGASWADVVRAAQSGDLRSGTVQVEEVVRLWDAYLRKLGFRMRAQLGVEVGQRLTREEKADPTTRFKGLCATALEQGILQGVMQVPGAAGDVTLDLVVAAQAVRYSVELDAPGDMRARTRVSWLLRQLERDAAANGDVVVKVNWQYKKYRTQATLAEAMADAGKLFIDAANTSIPADAMPKSFTLERTIRLPKGKGRSNASILEGVSKGFEEFYGGVVSKLKAYVAPPPQMPEEAKPAAASALPIPGTDAPAVAETPPVATEPAIIAQEPPAKPESELPK